MNILDGSLSYKGYQRSAATSGLNVTQPAPLENSTGSPVGGTITGLSVQTGTNNPASGEKITLKVDVANGDGTTQTINFTSAASDGSQTVADLFANGVEGDVDGWKASIDASGNLTLTATKDMGAMGADSTVAVTVSGDKSTTSLDTITGTATVENLAAGEAEDTGTAAVISGGAFTTQQLGQTVAQNQKATLAVTYTPDGGSATTLTFEVTVTDAAGQAAGAALNGAKTADGKWELSVDSTTGDFTVKQTTPEDLEFDANATITAQLSSDDSNIGIGNTPANATGTIAGTDGVAPAAAGDTEETGSTMPESTVKREGTWTLEVDTSKMTVGDVFSIQVGDGQAQTVTYNGEDNTEFAQMIATKLGLTDGAKGSAVLANEKISVKLDTEGTPAKPANAMMIQVGALEKEQLAISIDAMNTKGLNLDDVTLDDQTLSGKAITRVREAINIVSDQRATLGAMQNRLEHKIANLNVSTENLSAAESRIRDVDMAQEMTNFTKNNILSQAATAMLAQANALPQNVLSLLG